jgi:hypothetical protein
MEKILSKRLDFYQKWIDNLNINSENHVMVLEKEAL